MEIASWGSVHHTDAAREYAYDRDARVRKLDKAGLKQSGGAGRSLT